MAWDEKTHNNITSARLKLSRPEAVYAELREYGDFIRERHRWSGDSELEKTLLGRNDPLINLGLAQFATDVALIGLLYKRGRAESADPAYGKALRVACLSNRNIFDFLSMGSGKGIDAEELKRLAREGDDAEIWVMLQNPTAGRLLGSLFNRKAPFDNIPEDRRGRLIAAASGNPRINTDESTEDGPDMELWDIHKGIYAILATAPLERDWAQVLHQLLWNMAPSAAQSPDSDPSPVIARWATVKVEKSFGDKKGQDQEGYITQLSFVDELRCLIAALYGRRYEDKTFIQVGSPNDADIALRCAFYGKGTLTVEQMKAGYERDRSAFVMAALMNMNVFWSRECRAALEGMLGGGFFQIYKKRLDQLREGRPRYDLQPLTESAAELDEESKAPSEEMTAIGRLDEKIAALVARIDRLQTTLLWGLGAAIVVYWLTKR